MKKRYYIVIAALLFGASVAKAQDHIKLDLQKNLFTMIFMPKF